MNIHVRKSYIVTNNSTCTECEWLRDERNSKINCFFCLLFHRCLQDTLEYTKDCKEARTGKTVHIF